MLCRYVHLEGMAWTPGEAAGYIQAILPSLPSLATHPQALSPSERRDPHCSLRNVSLTLKLNLSKLSGSVQVPESKWVPGWAPAETSWIGL